MAKRGRPTQDPTKEERKKVKELAADKAPIADIAKILGRSIPTLKKYFFKELFSEKKLKRPTKKASTGLPFTITAVHRKKVERYAGGKMTPLQISLVLGCTEEQLTTHFGPELAAGAARYRARVLDHLDEQMEDGLVGATNRLEAITALPEATASPGAHLGKKAAASAAAHAAAGGTNKFAPPPPPLKLVSNNDK